VLLWYNVHWRNGKARHATDDNIRPRMRILCWITKTTETHSDYKISIFFLRHQWLSEAPPCSFYWLFCFLKEMRFCETPLKFTPYRLLCKYGCSIPYINAKFKLDSFIKIFLLTFKYTLLASHFFYLPHCHHPKGHYASFTIRYIILCSTCKSVMTRHVLHHATCC
jgi:hypothetical protein